MGKFHKISKTHRTHMDSQGPTRSHTRSVKVSQGSTRTHKVSQRTTRTRMASQGLTKSYLVSPRSLKTPIKNTPECTKARPTEPGAQGVLPSMTPWKSMKHVTSTHQDIQELTQKASLILHQVSQGLNRTHKNSQGHTRMHQVLQKS